ncbi:MAG: flagellar hook-associated protein FlgK [bacterium]|nr:flagellar hook-associated protein FlgK [bacterium]
MANFGAKLLNTAISSLNAQQGVLASISNNIANANTPGYARRSVQLENQSSGDGKTGLNIGSGVKISSLIRYVDEFANRSLREAVQNKSNATTKDDLLSRVEDLFSLTGDTQTIGITLTDFFAALNDLTVNPASLELRANVIERGRDLVGSIKDTYNSLANLQREIDEKLVIEVDSINLMTSQIATLNQLVAQRESTGNVAADERDRRDFLLEKLSGKLSFNVTELSDGTINVTLPSGLDLVYGSNSRDLEVTNSPSFAGSSLPPTLWGGTPSFIVYNYGGSGGAAHVDLTGDIASGSGGLAGLLNVRGVYSATDTSPFQGDGVLPELASRIEGITRFLLTEFNEEYLGPDETSGGVHQASSMDLDGNIPGVYGFFDFAFSGLKDTDGDGLPDDLGTHAGVTNYSSLLQLASTDPRDIAAGRDLNATAGVLSGAPGDATNLQALVDLQDDTYTDTVGGFSFTGTIEQFYVNAVSFVGNEKSKSATDKTVSDSNYKIAADRRDQVSATSIDEEFTSLTRFQKAYEASARLIRIGNQLLDEIFNAL